MVIEFGTKANRSAIAATIVFLLLYNKITK